jgi:uncharacterized protein YndB with AHSA1/START domain
MTSPGEDPTARVVRLEVEVPGTPERVWAAIATGPGIACWFVPADVEEREGGAITTYHGPYGASHGTVTAWEPPRRFAYEERDWTDSDPPPPPWATEILVEARSGGTCVVRLASGLFSDGEHWADDIDPTETGWRQGLENLRLYLTHFPGLRCAGVFAMQRSPAPQEHVWGDLSGGLGLAAAAPGERVRAPAGAPPFAGVVETAAPDAVVVRTDAPAPGLLEVAAPFWSGHAHVSVRAYFYGDRAPAEAAAASEAAWNAWIGERFPSGEAAA